MRGEGATPGTGGVPAGREAGRRATPGGSGDAGGPSAVVVVPARDEAGRIAACIDAIAAQRAPGGTRPWVVVVDDGSRDATRQVAADALRRAGLVHEILDGPGSGVGWARRTGMDRAARWALAAGRPDCVLASTDADTLVDPGWLAALSGTLADGADLAAGDVRLRDDEPASPAATAARERAVAGRLAAVRTDDPGAPHHHFSAANLALTVAAHEAVGGMPTDRALEDEALLRAARDAGLRVVRTAEAVVRTSPRPDGRADRGLAVDLAVGAWCAERRHHHDEFPVERLARLVGDRRLSVVLPARNVAGTIGGVLARTVGPLVAAGVVHEVLVVDADSPDGTARVAAEHGAVVLQQDELRPDVGPCRGKGDAMWRALHVATGDVVAFLDADTADPRPAHLAGTIGPLLADDDVHMVRGAFDRPMAGAGGALEPHGGGRVTELAARPLLNLHVPLLAGFRQPLAGEFAGRAELLRALPFPTGYGVEVATLVDALRRVGLDGLAECDLGERRNRHQPLRDLSAMAFAVLCAVERRIDRGAVVPGGLRLPWDGDRVRAVPTDERPPVGPRAADEGDRHPAAAARATIAG